MLVAGVVGATLDVVPRGFGFAGIGAPKVLGGLEGCMWGYNGKLGRMVRGWDMPKSNEVDVKSATKFAVAGLAAGWCAYNLRTLAADRCLWLAPTLLFSP